MSVSLRDLRNLSISLRDKKPLQHDFLPGASADFLKLACLNVHQCQGFRYTHFQKFTWFLGRVQRRILVANLATIFQDLVPKVENSGALVTVVGAISFPVLCISKH